MKVRDKELRRRRHRREKARKRRLRELLAKVMTERAQEGGTDKKPTQ